MKSAFVTLAFIAILLCVSNEAAQGQASRPAATAVQHELKLIRGLDGAWYEHYSRATIEATQRALRERGLYSGPISGILDPATMNAIYAFQKASYHLQMCGVPTPRTREVLTQGSHTDPKPLAR
jgi:hypothetical protein